MFRAAAGIVLAASSAAGQSVFFSEIRFDLFGTGMMYNICRYVKTVGFVSFRLKD